MTPQGLAELSSDEGLSLIAYPDPMSGAEPWTIGYGCTGPGIVRGVVWTRAQAEEERDRRIGIIEMQMPALLGAGVWSKLAPARQDVLVNMAYNIGVKGLAEFKYLLSAIKGDDWSDAYIEMIQSHWASELPARAHRLADVMLKGVYAPD